MSEYIFRVRRADGHQQEHRLGEGTFTLGRDRGDVVLDEPSTSGSHGRLELRAGSATYSDLGSSNGSFYNGQRVSGPVSLVPGSVVRLAAAELTFVEYLSHAAATAAMPAIAVPAQPSPGAASESKVAPATPRASGPAERGSSSPYSHPDAPIRHSYPLAIESASLGEAFGLLLRTMPFLLARLGILVGMTIAAIIYWGLLVGGAVLFSKVADILAGVWVIALIGIGGALWRFVLRYMLYLIKAAHIAVLTELITTGEIGNGSEGMFQYGKRIVTERFGEVNILFGLDLLITGIVRAFNRTLGWVTGLIPIPGLSSVTSVVQRIVHASTTYIDETIFSYNLARGDDNAYRSAQDGLVYYAQNSKEVLKTGLWVVVLDYVLTGVVWVVMLLPGFLVGLLLPGSGSAASLTMIVVAALFASSVRSAVLRPLFLIMVMVKFHVVSRNQSINPEWDSRLSSASSKFAELKQRAQQWVSPGTSQTHERAA